MSKKFTASDVRRTAAAIEDKQMLVSSMLRAFADLLEAQEKAVPVRQFRVVPKGSTWTNVKDDEIWALVTAHPESYETRVLYAHSAQAQPPTARVSDEMVERARSAFVKADDGSTGITDAIRAALLVAQTQPPARTCSDERPCVNCFADQGGCLGPAPETVRQRKEQRAVEIAAAISTRPEFSRYESPLILGIVRATLAAQENPDD